MFRLVYLLIFSVIFFGCSDIPNPMVNGLGQNVVNITPELQENDPNNPPAPQPPGVPGVQCSSDLAENYQANEDCLFKYCDDQYTTGYDEAKDIAVKNFLANNPGIIQTDEVACQDDILPNNFKKYHTEQEAYLALNKYTDLYPDFVEQFEIGTTHENRSLRCLKISTPEARLLANAPVFVMVGMHHARELLALETPLRIIGKVLEKLENDSAFYEVMKSRIVYSCPMLNPDGGNHDKQNQFVLWRKNRRNNGGGIFGVDLNRNYSVGRGAGINIGSTSNNPNDDTYYGPAAFSEPETTAFKDFIETTANVKAIISFHSYSSLILYPLGSSNNNVAPDRLSVYQSWSQNMAQFNNYTPQKASALYVAGGDTCDWAEVEHSIYCVTFELDPPQTGGTFYYPDVYIDSVVDKNANAVYYTIEGFDDMESL